MSVLTLNSTAVPGAALLALEQLRKNTAFVRETADRLREESDLADLQTIIGAYNLPRPDLRWSPYGVTGTFRGLDAEVRYAVQLWAEAFTVFPSVVEPELVYGRGARGGAGWVSVSASVGGLHFTVAGRLLEIPGRAR